MIDRQTMKKSTTQYKNRNYSNTCQYHDSHDNNKILLYINQILNETHHFYDHIMNNHYTMSTPKHIHLNSHEKKTILNQSHVYHNEDKQKKYTDVTLCIYYNNDDENVLIVNTHRIILISCSSYFEALFKHEGPDSKNINISINHHIDDENTLKTFFKLFYTPIIDDSLFHYKECLSMIQDLFILNELSIQFAFDALHTYCIEKLYKSFSKESFHNILHYCLSQYYNCDNNKEFIEAGSKRYNIAYFIPHDKQLLFKRLISWFITCINDDNWNEPDYMKIINIFNNNNQSDENMDDEFMQYSSSTTSSSISLMDDERIKRTKLDDCYSSYSSSMSSSPSSSPSTLYHNNKNNITMNRFTHQNNPLICHNTELHKKKELYITNNEYKIKTLDLIGEYIHQFNQDYVHYSRYINNSNIVSFIRICNLCTKIENGKYGQAITQRISDNMIRKWCFAFTFDNITSSIGTIYCKSTDHYVNNETTNIQQRRRTPLNRTNVNMNIEMYCNTTITLLTKSFKEVSSSYSLEIPIEKETKPIRSNELNNIGQFILNNEDLCYNGRCDMCNKSDVSIYVIKYDVNFVYM